MADLTIVKPVPGGEQLHVWIEDGVLFLRFRNAVFANQRPWPGDPVEREKLDKHSAGVAVEILRQAGCDVDYGTMLGAISALSGAR